MEYTVNETWNYLFLDAESNAMRKTARTLNTQLYA